MLVQARNSVLVTYIQVPGMADYIIVLIINVVLIRDIYYSNILSDLRITEDYITSDLRIPDILF